ncbi:hypothetical protein WBP06_18500 (plasmid) [Novosphingobium sp. BL-8H]|uniref:hypothetical protein n=1 Tax=Novosphingobium sp. BL-8H TaxID=3127640 RepID=UPI003757B8E6
MSNGSNDFNVTFAHISFLERLLAGHPNIIEVTRSNDIQFDMVRERGGPIRLVCLNEYACGLARVFEAQEAFPGVNLIYVGGVWNSYTGDAKRHCRDAQIGLFNAKEITGALHRNDFWRYVRAS